MWFQQNGATSHTSREILGLLKEKFGKHIIFSRGEVNWSSISCDLTPLDKYLWDFLKSKM